MKKKLLIFTCGLIFAVGVPFMLLALLVESTWYIDISRATVYIAMLAHVDLVSFFIYYVTNNKK